MQKFHFVLITPLGIAKWDRARATPASIIAHHKGNEEQWKQRNKAKRVS